MDAALAVGMLGLGLLASGGVPKLQGESPTFRSAGARRSLPSDGRALPRYTERATHRGYEVSTGKIVVIATTNLDDARQAAAQAAEAWDETASLADHWMNGHRQPNFGQAAVQVVIGGDRVPLKQESSATVARIDRVTQIVMAGGGSLLRGIDRMVAQETGLPVHIADDPLSAVAEGTGRVLHELQFLKRVSANA